MSACPHERTHLDYSASITVVRCVVCGIVVGMPCLQCRMRRKRCSRCGGRGWVTTKVTRQER